MISIRIRIYNYIYIYRQIQTLFTNNPNNSGFFFVPKINEYNFCLIFDNSNKGRKIKRKNKKYDN